jgi:hypothetical protein
MGCDPFLPLCPLKIDARTGSRAVGRQVERAHEIVVGLQLAPPVQLLLYLSLMGRIRPGTARWVPRLGRIKLLVQS